MKVMHLLPAGLWLAAFSVALAQTPPKPAPKPAASKPAATTPGKPAEGKTLSLGGGSDSGGPLLTREELRACIKQEETIRIRLNEVEAQRVPLDAEKQAIATEQQALREARAPIDALKAQAEELSGRLKAFSARVDDWSQRVKAFNDANRTGTAADRQREDLNKERTEIEKLRIELESERTRLTAGNQEVVRNYNAKAVALDARVNDWNQRNAQWNDTSRKLEAERQNWVSSCADRRYREDDETAIKAGK